MKRLNESTSVNTILTSTRFLVSQLKGAEVNNTIIAPIESAMVTFNEAVNSMEDAKLNRMTATANRNYQDSLLDDVIVNLGRAVLLKTNGDRSSSLYTMLFPLSPSKGTKNIADSTQNQFVSNIEEQLKSNSEYAEFSTYLEEIEAMSASLETAVNAREEAYKQEDTARNALRISKDSLIETYNRARFILNMEMPGKTKLIESFFYRP